VKLGAVLPGQVVKKTVSVMNNSLAPLIFNQSVLFSTPELQDPKVSAWARGEGTPKGFFMLPNFLLIWMTMLATVTAHISYAPIMY
jgi:hypothetical protein